MVEISAPCTESCTTWLDVDDEDACVPCTTYGIDEDLLQTGYNNASDILFMLSARQFPGSCQITVRPFSCACGPGCHCAALRQISLGIVPITQIDEIRVRDGKNEAVKVWTTADSGTRYRVDNFRYLVRLTDTDGQKRSWPTSQQLSDSEADGEVFFQVKFTYGMMPPRLGVQAAKELGCELALACDPSTTEHCSLPRNLVSIARQGMTVQLASSAAFREWASGLTSVSAFLDVHNPTKMSRPPVVVDALDLDLRPWIQVTA